MQERIQKLKQQIEELKQWRLENSIQQIPFNPPVNTTTLMHQDHFVVQTNFEIFATPAIAVEVLLGEETLYIPAFPKLT